MTDLNHTDKKWVWIPHKDMCYIPAYILRGNNLTSVVVTQDNKEVTLATSEIQQLNPRKFDMASDLALLSYLNEASVLHNLRMRYEHDLIYTYSGLFLLAINPYKQLPKLYNAENASSYVAPLKQRKQYLNVDNQPHIFAVANDAYQSLKMNKEDQSILITGESGAGKTENTKKVIEFLAFLTNNKDDSKTTAKILETNVVLESFGNAQTLKNDNSSRFGKFIKIEFVNGKITGAHIEKYLLEKSRVTRVNKNERTYHVFYQLIKAIHSNKKHKDAEYANFLLNLKKHCKFEDDVSLDSFNYLKDTNHKIQDVDDASDFFKLFNSLTILEFTNEEKVFIFKILSAVLHLGNLKFCEENDQAILKNEDVAEKICNLLKIDYNKFIETLLNPTTRAGNEFVINSRTKEQTYSIVDALSKSLYEKMFDYIVNKINKTFKTVETTVNKNFIGVLDIAGFEIFNSNNFEQFCINFTNEKLQQFFNHHMFVLEQEIYRIENIPWDFIDFGMDLQPTIDLIEMGNPIGILSFLDEESVMPKGTDKTFLEKLREIEYKLKGNTKKVYMTYDQHHEQSSHSRGKVFDMSKQHDIKVHDMSKHYDNNTNNKSTNSAGKKGLLFELSKLKHGFIIDHYAGRVEYIVEDWLRKNKDPHFDYITLILKQSTDNLVQNLFNHENTGKKGFFRTVCQKHKDSLNLLMNQLKKTNPYFVRCIIPNNEKKPNQLKNDLVLHQLKCNGVMEGIRIIRQGYPTRLTFKQFRVRYEILIFKSGEFIDNKEMCMIILTTLKIGEENYKMGNTLLFFKQGVLAEIEDKRDLIVNKVAIQLNSLIRRALAHKQIHINELRKEKIKILQKNAKLYLALKTWPWWKLYLKIKPLLEISKMDEEIKLKENLISEATMKLKREKERNEEIMKRILGIENEKKIILDNLEMERMLVNEKEELLQGLRNENISTKEKQREMEEEIVLLHRRMEEMKNDTTMNNKLEDDKKKLQDQVIILEKEIRDNKHRYMDKEKVVGNNIRALENENKKYRDSDIKMHEKYLDLENEMGCLEAEIEIRENNIKKLKEENKNKDTELNKISKEKDAIYEELNREREIINKERMISK